MNSLGKQALNSHSQQQHHSHHHHNHHNHHNHRNDVSFISKVLFIYIFIIMHTCTFIFVWINFISFDIKLHSLLLLFCFLHNNSLILSQSYLSDTCHLDTAICSYYPFVWLCFDCFSPSLVLSQQSQLISIQWVS